MAGSLRLCCGLAALLQWPVARSAATASQRCCDGQKRAGARNANSAVEPWPTLRCSVFFFTRQFQRENESKTERKETGLRNLFPGSVGWQAPSTSTPCSGSSNISTLRQQQHTSTLR
jgi:hypothetical protein